MLFRSHEPPAKPKHIYVLSEIPVTGVGKIFKPELRRLAAEKKIGMEATQLLASETSIQIRAIENQEMTFTVSASKQIAVADLRRLEEIVGALGIKLIPESTKIQ